MSASLRQRVWPAPECTDFILQRGGGRPVRFVGSILACRDDAAPPAWARLRLALYRREDGGYVSEILCQPAQYRPAGADCPAARCRVAAADNLAAALAAFENAPAETGDVGPVDAPDDAAAALFEAAGRLCRATAQERALRHAVGDFLYRLCIDNAEP